MHLLEISETAQDRIKELLDARGKPSLGVRIGVRTRGCSGRSYTFEYVDTEEAHDEHVPFSGFSVYIDPKALVFIIGMRMDYVEEDFRSGFVFHNPNEKARCGCGESFHV